MIIARGIGRDDGDGDELLLLGLSLRNIEELVKGRPIRLTTESHGAGVPLGWTILIVVGETEASLAAKLKEAGVVDSETCIVAQPREVVDHPPAPAGTRPKKSVM